MGESRSDSQIVFPRNAREVEETINRLKQMLESEYEEATMLELCQAYLFADDTNSSMKMYKRLKRLFPYGEYLEEEDKLLAAIEGSRVNEYLRSLSGDTAILSAPQAVSSTAPSQAATAVKETQSLASALKKQTKKKKCAAPIPQNIEECFADIIAMETVKQELDQFYKLLRFQVERKQNDFQAELLKSTHFAVTGARGCGKTMVGGVIAKLLCDFGIRAASETILVQAREIRRAFHQKQDEGVETLFSALSDTTVIVENLQDIAEQDADGAVLKDFAVSLEKVMRNKKDAISIVLTGTAEAIKRLLAADETLEDTLYAVINIPPYSSQELLAITEKLAREKALRVHDTAKKALLRKIDMEYKREDFLNAISLTRYLDDAAVKMADRYYTSDTASEAEMVYLMPEDFDVDMETEDLEGLLAELDALTGLASVKGQIRKRMDTIRADQQAQEAGAMRRSGHGTLHMLFTGNPGTGKTTVARLLGRIYQQLGVLPRGNIVVECTRSELVGEYQGHTARRVKEKVREALGGVLFIDEAYALVNGNQDSFGKEAVDELIAAIENNRDNMMVILAGYSEEMKAFLKSNPGFRSRIRNDIHFEDYSTDEMVEIFEKMLKGKELCLEQNIGNALFLLLESKSKMPDFGNARGVRNILEEVLEVQNERLITASDTGVPVAKSEYDTIRRCDLECVLGKKSPDEKTLEELLGELNALTGLQSVKQQIQEMVDDIQVKNYMAEKGIAGNMGRGTLHLVFKGNAGTGKTTVARLLGQIYKKLGLLSKNIFVETGRKDLVASYMGQTAGRVISKIKEAEGGILFIDEAYTLKGGEQDEFGMEAINTLVAELENRRDKLMVIVAGYGDEMQKFLDANQGLASRLSNEIVFEDYSNQELLSIFQYMVQKKGMRLEDGLEEFLLRYIAREKAAVKDFGNARGIRNLIEKIDKKKNSRIAKAVREGVVLEDSQVCTIIKADFGGADK